MQKFFNLANEKKIDLNPMEIRVRDELVAAGILELKEGRWQAKVENAAVIATYNEKREDFDHELNHAIYFSDPQYRKAAQSLWDELQPSHGIFLKSILQSAFGFEYDFENDKELLVREFAAYFRDPEDFLRNYVKETTRDAVRERVISISERVIQLEKNSTAYSGPYKDFRALNQRERLEASEDFLRKLKERERK